LNSRAFIFAMSVCALAGGGAHAQQNIGSTVLAHNNVSRELAGAAAPLNPGDPVYRDELVRTGNDSTAKLIFLDSTNLAIGPTSRVTLDRFVYVGETNGQQMTVNLAKGIFRFTTGKLDKSAYTISTPTTWLGVRGTVLDIDAHSLASRWSRARPSSARVAPGLRSSSKGGIVQGPRAGRTEPAATALNFSTPDRLHRSRSPAARIRRA
jgi:hypothetical protein